MVMLSADLGLPLPMSLTLQKKLSPARLMEWKSRSSGRRPSDSSTLPVSSNCEEFRIVWVDHKVT